MEQYLEYYSSDQMKNLFIEEKVIFSIKLRKKILFMECVPDSDLMMIIYFPNIITFYNLITSSKSPEYLIISDIKHFFQIFTCCFNEEGSSIYFAGNNSSILKYDYIIDLPINFIKKMNEHKNFVSCLAFSHKRLASGSFDKTIKIWNQQGNYEKTLSGHSDKVLKISFSMSGRLLASGGCDNAIKIWNVEEGIEIKV